MTIPGSTPIYFPPVETEVRDLKNTFTVISYSLEYGGKDRRFRYWREIVEWARKRVDWFSPVTLTVVYRDKTKMYFHTVKIYVSTFREIGEKEVIVQLLEKHV